MDCDAPTNSGNPCRAKPLKGTTRCLAHSDAETRASVGFVAEAGKLGGRPPNPRAVDVLRERLEANVDAILNPLFGMATSAEAESVQLAAIREVLDRGYGKPRQGTDVEVSGSLSLNVLDLAASLEPAPDAEEPQP